MFALGSCLAFAVFLAFTHNLVVEGHAARSMLGQERLHGWRLLRRSAPLVPPPQTQPGEGGGGPIDPIKLLKNDPAAELTRLYDRLFWPNEQAGPSQILVMGYYHSGAALVTRLLMLMGAWAGEPRDLLVGEQPRRAAVRAGWRAQHSLECRARCGRPRSLPAAGGRGRAPRAGGPDWQRSWDPGGSSRHV